MSTFSTSSRQKRLKTLSFFTLLTSKCASRHNGVHFFDTFSSKSGPRPSVFNTFDFKMCFAPQRRALFRHHNFQKWSGPGVFCTFWLGNVLRATTACSFSTSQLPKVLRSWGVFCTFWLGNVLRATTACTFLTSQLPKVLRSWGVICTFWLGNVLRATTACAFLTSELPKVDRTPSAFNVLTSKCASRHNSVHFFDIGTRNFQKLSDAGVFCTFWLGNVLRATTACNFSSLLWPAGSAPAALASLLFDPPEPQIIGKTQCLATFLPFRASASSFFLLFLFWSSLF